MFKMSKRIQTQKHAYNCNEIWEKMGKERKFDKMLTKTKKGLNKNCNKLQRNP